MANRKNISITLLLFIILIISYSCKKEYDTIDYQKVQNSTKNYVFMKNSKWVYKSDSGLLYDTVKCSETIKDSIDYIFETFKGVKVYYILEYYKMTLNHSINNKIETHYFYIVYDKVNSSIINNNIIGQCVLLNDDRNEPLNFDGFYNLLDTTININSNNYICQHNRIIASQQIVNVYDYNTDLFFVENIGLVRKHDNLIGWNLESYNVSNVNF
jgi:hypothetical protein